MVKFVEPRVFLIAETRNCGEGMQQMLNAVGANQWRSKDPKSQAELLIEVAGRMCYKSFGTELNSNLTKVREGNHDYIGNILRSGHGSVLEHASATFGLVGISRVVTHEIVRHRAGVAYSQESMRFVSIDNMRFYYPDAFGGSKYDLVELDIKLSEIEDDYKEMQKELLDPDMPFSKKKKITSAMRRMLPDGICTDLVMTANHRAWRHMIAMRTSIHAEEEIRKVFNDIAIRLKVQYPAIYQDMSANSEGEWVFENDKI